MTSRLYLGKGRQNWYGNIVLQHCWVSILSDSTVRDYVWRNISQTENLNNNKDCKKKKFRQCWFLISKVFPHRLLLSLEGMYNGPLVFFFNQTSIYNLKNTICQWNREFYWFQITYYLSIVYIITNTKSVEQVFLTWL